ncbi:cold-shock protein [Rhizobium sp. 18065]|uniref:cold-shock protein n=1 Tax=Rhizobium sp. 18065 TaxID=2681411 RepID=UPI001358F13F|nr:cold-shock protein [Rhizobium sp. 18065]
MSGHKFAIGDMIFLKDGPVRVARTPGVCKITATLPETGGKRQYRVRFEAENFDRCVGEDDIDPTRSQTPKQAPAHIQKEQGPWLKVNSVRTAK